MPQDLRLALRMSPRSPGVSSLAILCLTLGNQCDDIGMRMASLNRATRTGVSWSDIDDSRRSATYAVTLSTRELGRRMAVGEDSPVLLRMVVPFGRWACNAYNRGMADLWELVDLCTPWCVHVVVTLRVAEHIEAGKCSIAEIAQAAGCDAWNLHRVMQHLLNKGVFEEPEDGRFALNEAARGLLNPMLRIGLNLDGFGGRMAHAWGTMLKYVRTGSPAYSDVFGRPFWDDLDAHPEIAAEFDALIGAVGHGTPDPDFDITGGWEAVRWVVDVGGGTGGMLAEILRARPQVRGTLVDLPRTVARSDETFAAARVSDRVSSVGQSFFNPLPAGADIYLVRGVINDWGDRESTAILRRCAEAAGAAGRVVVLKGVGPEQVRRPLTIEMVLAGGKHRTVGEFQALARDAGLNLLSARQQKSYFVVECRPFQDAIASGPALAE